MVGVSAATSLWLLPTMSSLFYFFSSKDQPEDYSHPKTCKAFHLKEKYDFIIVGAGTAGCVLANRLSEDDKYSVLLLEAGDEEPPEIQIPSVAGYHQLTDMDWQYSAEPSFTSCLSMNNNSCLFPRGKSQGGSSSINYMLYVRGNKKDYDDWEASGNPGWDYQSILPYFKKSEANSNEKLDSYYHGRHGYQKVSEAGWWTPLRDMFIDAVQELDYSILDINGAKQSGFMIPQGFYHEGARYSASKAFLKPIRDERNNLDVLLKAHVTKIHLNEFNRATGVSFILDGENYETTATKEVILSAGAFGSPQLLMLSGVGPYDILDKFKIDRKIDLKVGSNLQDHVAGGLTYTIDKPVSLKRSRLHSFEAVYQYARWGTGPLATFGTVEGLGYAHTKYSDIELDWPDIMLHFFASGWAADVGRYSLNVKDEVWDNYLKDLHDQHAITILVKLMRPKSIGYVELASSNPMDQLKIVPNYFNSSFDMSTLIEGMKIAIKIGDTEAFKSVGAKLYDRPLPGCENWAQDSDMYLECVLRHFTLTIFHYCGTAKMGPSSDPDAVVDSQLRVYGTSGLRVVDASIFPRIPTGNTNAPVLMVAEKASDMIKEFWTNIEESGEDSSGEESSSEEL